MKIFADISLIYASILILGGLGISPTQAQSLEKPSEYIILSTDKAYYVSGESLWFSALVGQQASQSPVKSTVLYLELLSSNGQALSQQKLKIKDGKASGRIFLDPSWEGGTYSLLAYTSWMKNQKEGGMAPYPLLVINPYRKSKTISTPTDSAAFNIEQSINQEISIRTDKKHYTKREKAALLLDFSQIKHPINFTVSVYQAVEDLENTMRLYQRTYQTSQPSVFPLNSQIDIIPELNGPIIQGRTTQAQIQKVNISFPGKASEIYGVLPKEDGTFALEVSPEINSSNLIIWSEEPQFDPSQWKINSPFLSQTATYPEIPFKISTSSDTLLQALSIQSQISNAYIERAFIRGMPVESSKRLQLPFYGNANHQYQLDDYTQFPFLDEVILEYVRYVSRYRRSGEDELRVWDFYANLNSLSNTLEFPQAALVLVDGIPVKDLEELWKVNTSKIAALEVISRKYYTASSTFFGIVHFISKKEDFAGMEIPENIGLFNFVPLEKEIRFFHPDYEMEDSELSHIPDTRNTLFWKPHTSATPDSFNEFSFYTGDTQGKYYVKLEAWGQDGKYYSSFNSFTVE